MRTFVHLVAVVVLASLFIACAGDEPNTLASTRAEPPPGIAAASAWSESEIVTNRIDVSGVVATDLDAPVTLRSVVLVDARGARHDLVTDADGRFRAPDVLPPYDVAVASPSGLLTIHLGLRRSAPWIELVERDGPLPSHPSQTIRIGVHTGWCSSCAVTALTVSPLGAGTLTTTSEGGKPLTVVDVEHRWRGMAVPNGERIDVHVLVVTGDKTTFAYGRREGLVALPGEIVDFGVIETAPVATTEPLVIEAGSHAATLVDWRWSTTVFLGVSAGPASPEARFLYEAATDSAVTLRAPAMPGLGIHANIVATHPRSDEQGGFHRSTEVWSGRRALSNDSIELAVDVGPETVRPLPGGTFSRRGSGFEWRSTRLGNLARLTVADVARSRVRFRVITAGQEVPLARLARLGAPKLEPGDHLLDLSTAADVAIDDAVSPDVAVRHGRFARTRPGMATSLRVPFQVTN